jgi:glycosyltransferase involved in cell wall biosynthesis
MSFAPIPILMIGAHPYKVKGGVSACVRNILSSDIGRKYRIYYIATMVDGLWIVKLGWAIRSLVIFLFNLIFTRVSLVHIHGSKYASFYRKIIFIILAKVWRKKIIFHCHSGKFDQFYFHGPDWQKSLIRWVLSLPDRIVVLSPHWALLFSQIVPISKLIILENAEPLEFYQSKGVTCSKASEPTILFAGLLTENKGVFDLISIVPELANKIPSVRVLLAGTGDLKKIDSLVKSHGVAGSVQLLGWLDPEHLIGLYHQSHLFVLPSYYEGLPMVILEAMACGLPIVSTKVGGIPELIEEGQNGHLINPGDRKALLEILITLLADTTLREVMGQNNIQKIRENYNIPIFIQKLESLYGELLGDK